MYYNPRKPLMQIQPLGDSGWHPNFTKKILKLQSCKFTGNKANYTVFHFHSNFLCIQGNASTLIMFIILN